MGEKLFDWIMVTLTTVLTIALLGMIGAVIYGLVLAVQGQQVCQ